VEKRIILDDLPVSERKSDRLLATLPPRPATIYADSDCIDLSQLRHFKSEANVSRPKSSPASSAPEGARTRQEPIVIRRLPKRVISKQLVTSASFSNHQSLSKQIRSDLDNRAPYGNGTRHQDVPRGSLQSQQPSHQPPNGNSRVSASDKYHNRSDVNSTRVVEQPFDERHHQGNLANGSRTRRPKSVPPNMLNQFYAPVDNCNDMGSQYEPGNVRHLVQSYQSAFRPPTTSTQGQGAVSGVAQQQRPAQGHSPPDNPARDLERSLSVNQARNQGLRASQQRDATDTYRTDNNVCVVRPANGRTLPEPPSKGSAGRGHHDYQSPSSKSRHEQYSMSEKKEPSKGTQVYYESVCL